MQEIGPQKLVEFDSPDPDSPIITTSNSKLTYKMFKMIFDASKVKAFTVPTEANGYTLDNTVAANAFTGMAVMKALNDSSISNKATSNRTILPGLARDLKGDIERVTRWTLEDGPMSGFELPLYLLNH